MYNSRFHVSQCSSFRPRVCVDALWNHSVQSGVPEVDYCCKRTDRHGNNKLIADSQAFFEHTIFQNNVIGILHIMINVTP